MYNHQNIHIYIYIQYLQRLYNARYIHNEMYSTYIVCIFFYLHNEIYEIYVSRHDNVKYLQ
jgi:hypothetical protein